MIKLLVSPSCTSCRKARQWLDDHGVNYIERDISKDPLTIEELKHILSLTESGVDDLISKRSRAFRDLNLDIDKTTIDELLDLFISYPSLVRRPIVLDDRRLQIGYNEDEIRCFLPRNYRDVERALMYEEINVAGA